MNNELKQDMNTNNNVIGVSNKYPLYDFVLIALRKVMFDRQNEILIRARGMAIPAAINIAEILRTQYIKNCKISTEIGSELMDYEHVASILIKISDIKSIN
jgi:DNA-binding protein Alba